MTDLPIGRPLRPAQITGLAATSAYGRGAAALIEGVLAGTPAFTPVSRFAVDTRRSRVAATLPGEPDLFTELTAVITEACADAGLGEQQRATTPLLLAVHCDPAIARAAARDRPQHSGGAFGAELGRVCGLAARTRVYISACVAASTAVADGAAMISRGDADRVVVAAGYLVDADQFALFDAGRALSTDGSVRPFSVGRTGLLLGDGVAAIVVESTDSAQARHAPISATIRGWGRAGDAYHAVQPDPQGSGLARAIDAALRRAGISTVDLGYINAHGSGSTLSDIAESTALRRVMGEQAGEIPVSSTKSLHGQALEASALVELVTTILALRQRRLPINAGFLGPDDQCPLNVVVESAPLTGPPTALCLNSAFGGANTALVVGVS